MGKSSETAVIEVIPSAHRLVKSLRDIGYDFVQAVADVVDNCIAARATEVDITLRFDGARSWVRVADNGAGMAAQDLTEAMRYGSEREYEADDLSKFGLGLKTASMSQCRRLSVASRIDSSTRRLEARAFDLDYIEKTNKWHVLDLGPEKRSDALVQPLKQHAGTVVLWEKLDRVLDYKSPHGEWAKARLLQLAEDLELHLGMVFHRFLAGECHRKRTLSIAINNAKVEPWDPFARNEKSAQQLPKQEFRVSGSSGRGIVIYRPHILPPKERFSSQDAFERLSGPRKWNQQQGFYVYRADRMIQSGGWCGMRTADEHTKLARASLDFYPDLDDAFEINVSKVRVKLPAELRDELATPVENLCKRARLMYGQKVPTPLAGLSTATRGEAAPAGGSASPSESATEAPPRTDESPRVAIEKAAGKAGERDALRRILKVLKEDSPEVASDLGW